MIFLDPGMDSLPKAILTSTFVRRSVCPEGVRRVDYFDKDFPGFLLEIRSSGGSFISAIVIAVGGSGSSRSVQLAS
jgi:hypothetical protein